MQTFVPIADNYLASVEILDQQRLGKQRVETYQLMSALTGLKLDNVSHRELVRYRSDRDGKRVPVMATVAHPESEWRVVPVTKKGWTSHPAALMWSGHEGALLEYQTSTVGAWLDRGYNDTCLAKTRMLFRAYREANATIFDAPLWWGDERVHSSHRANLLRKKPEFYSKLGWTESPDMPYHWPTQQEAS